MIEIKPDFIFNTKILKYRRVTLTLVFPKFPNFLNGFGKQKTQSDFFFVVVVQSNFPEILRRCLFVLKLKTKQLEPWSFECRLQLSRHSSFRLRSGNEQVSRTALSAFPKATPRAHSVGAVY